MSTPFRLPAAVLAATPAAQDDLDFLRQTDPAAASPYQSVYPSRRGWQGRAFKRRVGRVAATPREAALVVVRWWKHWYGDRWREYFAHRQTPGWVLLPAPDGGWHPVVHLVEGIGSPGIREVVRFLPVVYGGKRAAAAAVQAWAAERYGRWAPLVMRRWWTPTHRAERRTPVPQVGVMLMRGRGA